MKKISIIILLMIGLFLLLLTGCGITPEIDIGNSEYQIDTSDTGTVDTGGTVVTEGTGTVKVDTTKTGITGSRAPLPNSFGWNNTDVTVSFSCTDTGPVQSGIDTNTVAGKTLTTEGKDQSVTNTGECIDVAGNIADPVTVSNIHIDKTPPVVMVTLPGTGEYVLNQSITATWSATDALSGVVAPASGSVSIDTSSEGTKTFTLPAGTATDKAGNSSLEVSISYSVIADTEEMEIGSSQKWSGLSGIVTSYDTVAEFTDTWLDNGFTEVRWCTNYTNAAQLAASKAAIIAGNAKGLEFIWGVSAPSPITSTNWPDFRTAILAAATWAQDNGVYEFQIGNEELYHNDDDTLTDAQLITNLKAVATEVQAIFTSGNVSYSAGSPWPWIEAGKGDIDLLAYNVYMGGNTFDDWWKTEITSLVNAFGVDGTYITEFGPSYMSLDDYSTDESVQAAGVTEMIDYFKASGIKRAFYFEWIGDEYGVIKLGVDEKIYRLLWNQALLNSESVKFATVPTKTTTASLPNAIALIQN